MSYAVEIFERGEWKPIATYPYEEQAVEAFDIFQETLDDAHKRGRYLNATLRVTEL